MGLFWLCVVLYGIANTLGYYTGVGSGVRGVLCVTVVLYAAFNKRPPFLAKRFYSLKLYGLTASFIFTSYHMAFVAGHPYYLVLLSLIPLAMAAVLVSVLLNNQTS